MNFSKTSIKTVALALVLSAFAATSAEAGPREDIIAKFQAQAEAPANPANGEQMYNATYGTGKPDTPKCTTCHGATPQQGGETRTAKLIDPMAVSKTPDRFTDAKKVDKWFRRNCTGVIGRECTAQEKVDFLTFLAGQ
ncbi:MAG: DUF1924 domain-containing protein [Rhodospirillaceae bacterium]|nr:DUF1924 domain-containing protein [Rhodospirillaceae bacterium]